jgi:hypothetical protein
MSAEVHSTHVTGSADGATECSELCPITGTPRLTLGAEYSDSSSSDGLPLLEPLSELRERPPGELGLGRGRENGLDAPLEIISDHWESTMDRIFGARLITFWRSATLKPRRNTAWFSDQDSSPGRRRGPELNDELALSHSHAHDTPAVPTWPALSFNDNFPSPEWFSTAATLHDVDLVTPVMRYSSPLPIELLSWPLTNMYQFCAWVKA